MFCDSNPAVIWESNHTANAVWLLLEDISIFSAFHLAFVSLLSSTSQEPYKTSDLESSRHYAQFHFFDGDPWCSRQFPAPHIFTELNSSDYTEPVEMFTVNNWDPWWRDTQAAWLQNASQFAVRSEVQEKRVNNVLRPRGSQVPPLSWK